MQITRQLLQAQRAHAVAERDSHLAKANAQIGAINAFDHLLAVLEQPEHTSAPAAPTGQAPEPIGPVKPA